MKKRKKRKEKTEYCFLKEEEQKTNKKVRPFEKESRKFIKKKVHQNEKKRKKKKKQKGKKKVTEVSLVFLIDFCYFFQFFSFFFKVPATGDRNVNSSQRPRNINSTARTTTTQASPSSSGFVQRDKKGKARPATDATGFKQRK